jgi:hypothetical protein
MKEMAEYIRDAEVLLWGASREKQLHKVALLL